MKPISSKESHYRSNFKFPHSTWYHDALELARKKWKRNRSKLLRRQAKVSLRTELKDLE